MRPHNLSGVKNEYPWSYSALSSFELCPKKYAAESVHKTIKYQQNEAASYGDDAHKAIELRVKKHKPLPLDLRHHEENIMRLAYGLKGEVVTEQRLAINRDFEPVDFFADDVWYRGKADMLVYNPDTALCVDWKTGKMRPDFDQLDLMVAAVKRLLPTLKRAMGLFYWTKSKKVTRKTYEGEEFGLIWQRIAPRVQNYQRARREDDFPERPNFLCKKYCRVTGCKYHGVGAF